MTKGMSKADADHLSHKISEIVNIMEDCIQCEKQVADTCENAQEKEEHIARMEAMEPAVRRLRHVHRMTEQITG